MLRLGFTGTRHGMTQEQYREVDEWLHMNKAGCVEFHHGGCIGADTEFHQLLSEHGLLKWTIVHPSDQPEKRGKLVGEGFLVLTPHPPLDRNKMMVNVIDVLLAAPFETYEVLRSGTWATVRYAQKSHKEIRILHPR